MLGHHLLGIEACTKEISSRHVDYALQDWSNICLQRLNYLRRIFHALLGYACLHCRQTFEQVQSQSSLSYGGILYVRQRSKVSRWGCYQAWCRWRCIRTHGLLWSIRVITNQFYMCRLGWRLHHERIDEFPRCLLAALGQGMTRLERQRPSSSLLHQDLRSVSRYGATCRGWALCLYSMSLQTQRRLIEPVDQSQLQH